MYEILSNTVLQTEAAADLEKADWSRQRIVSEWTFFVQKFASFSANGGAIKAVIKALL